VTGASRELRNEELHNLYTLQIWLDWSYCDMHACQQSTVETLVNNRW
jgi:hypothetical protein